MQQTTSNTTCMQATELSTIGKVQGEARREVDRVEREEEGHPGQRFAVGSDWLGWCAPQSHSPDLLANARTNREGPSIVILVVTTATLVGGLVDVHLPQILMRSCRSC